MHETVLFVFPTRSTKHMEQQQIPDYHRGPISEIKIISMILPNIYKDAYLKSTLHPQPPAKETLWPILVAFKEYVFKLFISFFFHVLCLYATVWVMTDSVPTYII